MKKLILHVGYPKTGTTSFQNSLFLNLNNEINYLGIAKEPISDYHNLSRRLLEPWLTSRGEEGREELKSLLADRLSYGMNLLSEESFINSRCNPGRVFDPVEIKKLLAPLCDSIDIVIVLRNQVDLIQSLYAHGFILDKDYDAWDTKKYINICLKNKENRLFFCFTDVIKKYKSVFGEHKVHVLLFEDFLSDKDCYFNGWEKILGIPHEILAEKMGDVHLHKKKKTSDGSYIINITSEPNKLKRFIKNLPLTHSIFSRLSKYKIIQNISTASNKPVDKKLVVPSFTDEEKLRIKKSFYQDNLKLTNVINANQEKLKKYNYI
tara:strand:+ start:301 stop:1263 length:963 start_codon:yes stop_codon:yes gene_type:complete